MILEIVSKLYIIFDISAIGSISNGLLPFSKYSFLVQLTGDFI